MDMCLNISRRHALGVHGQDLFLDVLADAGLVLFQYLRLKLAFTVSGYRYFYIPKAGAQCLAAVAVAAVIRGLVAVVVPAVAQFIVQLRLRPFSMNSAMVSLNRFWMSSMLPMFAIYSSSRIFSRRAFSSGLRFFLDMCYTSCVMLLFYTSREVYTKFGTVSCSGITTNRCGCRSRKSRSRRLRWPDTGTTLASTCFLSLATATSSRSVLSTFRRTLMQSRS